MNRIIQYLNQPLSVTTHRWKTTLLSTLAVCFVLGVFQPFGLARLDTAAFIIALGLSLVGTVLGLGIMLFLFPFLFKRYYGTWTVGKNILNITLLIFLIGILNGLAQLLYTYIYSGVIPDHWEKTLQGLFIATLLVSPIPILVSVIMMQNQNLKANLKEARELNIRLSTKATHSEARSDIQELILSGSTKESVKFQSDDLLYLEACGNYVKVYYRCEGSVKHKLLRTTIKQMEEATQAYPFVIRCHRAFLVNVRQVVFVDGNSQGYKLAFSGLTEEIPVSRAYTKEIKSYLEQL